MLYLGPCTRYNSVIFMHLQISYPEKPKMPNMPILSQCLYVCLQVTIADVLCAFLEKYIHRLQCARSVQVILNWLTVWNENSPVKKSPLVWLQTVSCPLFTDFNENFHFTFCQKFYAYGRLAYTSRFKNIVKGYRGDYSDRRCFENLTPASALTIS